MEVHFLIVHSTSTWPVSQSSSDYLCKIASIKSKKTKIVSQAEQQPHGTTKHHWETIGIPKNAPFKVNPYWLVDYKMNTMWVKMCRIKSGDTRQTIVMSSCHTILWQTVHTTRKSNLLHDPFCELTNENTRSLASLANVSIWTLINTLLIQLYSKDRKAFQ